MHFGVHPIPVCPRPSRRCCSSCSCTCIPSSCVARHVRSVSKLESGDAEPQGLGHRQRRLREEEGSRVCREGCWSGKFFDLESWGRDWRSRSPLISHCLVIREGWLLQGQMLFQEDAACETEGPCQALKAGEGFCWVSEAARRSPTASKPEAGFLPKGNDHWISHPV